MFCIAVLIVVFLAILSGADDGDPYWRSPLRAKDKLKN
jgi:hypothetical protein